MIFLRLLLIIFSVAAQASIWEGVDQPQAPIVKPLDLRGVKKITLRSACREFLLLPASFVPNDLNLIRGKLISYPRQSLRFRKKSKRIEKVYLDISDVSQDARSAALLAEGLGNELKVSQIKEQIQKFRARNYKKVSLVEFLPEFVKKEIGQVLDCDGPNCYNTAMRFHQIEKERFETYDYEVVQKIQNKYKALTPDTELKFGDLIVFWLGDGEKGFQGNIRHTAIYIGQGIVLHKASTAKGDPVTFEELQGVMEYYRTLSSPLDDVHSATFHRLKQ
jgi:hypothetical protein